MEHLTLEDTVITLSGKKFSGLVESDFSDLFVMLDERGLIFFPDASVETKPDYLKKLQAQEIVFRKVEIYNTIARTYGNTAVVQGEGYFSVKLPKNEFAEILNFIDVWIDTGTEMKLVSSHLVKLDMVEK